MFDYELEVSEIEKEFFSSPTLIKIVFNYMDLSFHLFSGTTDETFTIVVRHMNELRKYYHKKACLNCNHSKKVIDIFRFCIRRDKLLSKYLDKDLAGFDNEQGNGPDITQNIIIAPQPTIMEVETQSRMDWLLSKEVLLSGFEKTFDGLVGVGQHILAEFVTGKVLVLPTLSTN